LEEKLGWLVLLLLFGGCVIVLLPFLSALLWAVVLCYCVWPLQERLVRTLRGHRTPAALLMLLAMVVLLLVPFWIVGNSIAENVGALTAALRKWVESGPPAPPGWLARVPLAGGVISEQWREIAADSERMWRESQRFIQPVSTGLLRAGLLVGKGLLELTLSIFISFFLLRDGAAIAARFQAGIERIAGSNGARMLDVAGNTVRGVVQGVLGTGLAQAAMAGIGFAIAGVPGAAVLALITFICSVVPIGAPFVWVPASLWLFHVDRTGWGIFMIVWGMGVSTVDNFLKPWLISHGSRMPFLLIFLGVVGGALAFGFIGVFLGPTLLAVGFRLLNEWITMRREAEPPQI
jgi:predicted PurR-regulated permease PerM